MSLGTPAVEIRARGRTGPRLTITPPPTTPVRPRAPVRGARGRAKGAARLGPASALEGKGRGCGPDVPDAAGPRGLPSGSISTTAIAGSHESARAHGAKAAIHRGPPSGSARPDLPRGRSRHSRAEGDRGPLARGHPPLDPRGSARQFAVVGARCRAEPPGRQPPRRSPPTARAAAWLSGAMHDRCGARGPCPAGLALAVRPRVRGCRRPDGSRQARRSGRHHPDRRAGHRCRTRSSPMSGRRRAGSAPSCRPARPGSGASSPPIPAPIAPRSCGPAPRPSGAPSRPPRGAGRSGAPSLTTG